MPGIRNLYYISFLISSFLLTAQDTILLQGEKEDYVVNTKTFIYKYNKSVRIYDIDKIIAAPDSHFIPNTYLQEVNYGFYETSGWSKFSFTNTSETENWILKIHQGRVDSVQLYVQRSTGPPDRYPLTGHFQNIEERPVYSLNFAFCIPIPKGESITCYLYTQREFGRHATILNLQKQYYFEHYEHKFSMTVMVICGSILLAFVVGLSLFFFVRTAIYLYYSVYCLSFLLLVLADSGYLHAFIANKTYQTIINTFNTIFYYWAVGWHLLFTVVLLNLKTYKHKWLYYMGQYVGWLCCIVATLLMFKIPDVIRWWMIYISYFIIFYMDVYILYATSKRLAQKDPVVYLYLAGFMFTLIVASILMLADLQILDGINQNTDLFYFVPLVEIMFMVLGLGFHFSNTIKARFQAQLTLNETQNQIITIQEDERKRIAQDLHDDVGNSLAAVKNMLIQKRESVVIEKEIENIIQDIRNISHDLMPVDFKEYMLADVIRHTVNKFKDHPSIHFDYDHTGTIIKLDPIKELVIYRIVNELINNILKHSKATSVLIQLVYQEQSLVVMVEDNGVGFVKDTSEQRKGLGIKNIEYRAAYIGAVLSIESDSKGSLIILETPYEKK